MHIVDDLRVAKLIHYGIVFIANYNTNPITTQPFVKLGFPILPKISTMTYGVGMSLTLIRVTGHTMSTFCTDGEGPAYGFCPGDYLVKPLNIGALLTQQHPNQSDGLKENY